MQESQPLGYASEVRDIDTRRVASLGLCEAGDRTQLDQFITVYQKTVGIVCWCSFSRLRRHEAGRGKLTTTCLRTKSAISAGKRSYWPCSQRASRLVTFWPSMYPASRSRSGLASM